MYFWKLTKGFYPFQFLWKISKSNMMSVAKFICHKLSHDLSLYIFVRDCLIESLIEQLGLIAPLCNSDGPIDTFKWNILLNYAKVHVNNLIRVQSSVPTVI